MPLAARMRPRNLEEFVGQEHLIGPGRLLRRAIEADRLFSSLIFWGPPGSGKTTLAQVIASLSRSHFESLSAVLSGVKDIRQLVSEAEARRPHGQRTMVLIDEIHRFNKAQQDALLPHVEAGTLMLIGATTENPYFEIIGPLLSRARVFVFHPLSEAEILVLLRRALQDQERGLGTYQAEVDDEALSHLAQMAGGDARNALNALELAVLSTPLEPDGGIRVDLGVAAESIQRRAVLYDRDGDAHYDTISAFIKSVRGSDVDAALYWLARMVYAGEDPKFIVRRLFILAAEDIGLADSQALVQVAAAAQALSWVGLPEAQYHLAQATIYLALAPKSNSTQAYFRALQKVQEGGVTQVPLHLQDSQRDGRALGHGRDYKYPHDYPGHYVPQTYLPAGLEGERFYEPGQEGAEQDLISRWTRLYRSDPDS
ncbi:MAG: replication-associated recombination protein A [Deltaproteobacteria bacterium]|nr:MAG: replication-associated recombination protein A [Deltaproteobacteria bacterium]